MRILVWASALGATAIIVLAVMFVLDMQRCYERIRANGELLATPHGDIEFVTSGAGPPVLVVHGSGGGYDQAELIAGAALADGFRQILPSRFGYLRSDVPAEATWDDQAAAFAALLDSLSIDRVAVVAMSHGGPSALAFAELYPERVSSLTLLSCGVTRIGSDDQEAADDKGRALVAVYRFDFPYWFISRFFRGRFMELIGADQSVVAGLTSGQREIIESFIDFMNPASSRFPGVRFDNRTPLQGDRIAAVQAPTLIIHARDDQLQLYANAVFADETIPDSRLVSYERGGHILIAVEEREIKNLVSRHILEHFN